MPLGVFSPLCVTLTWEDKPQNFEHATSLSHSFKCYVVWNIPLHTWGQLSWLCFLPASCIPSSLLLVGGCEKQKRSWCCVSAAWRCNLNNLYYPCCSQEKSKTQPRMKRIDSTPAKTNILCKLKNRVVGSSRCKWKDRSVHVQSVDMSEFLCISKVILFILTLGHGSPVKGMFLPCLLYHLSFPEIWTSRTFGPLTFNGWPVNINLSISLASFIGSFLVKNCWCTCFAVKHWEYLVQMNHLDFKLLANVRVFSWRHHCLDNYLKMKTFV